jgi:hypothetical protein
MIGKPIEKMSVDHLMQMTNFHWATAEMFAERHEPRMAEQFRQLARRYMNELTRRRWREAVDRPNLAKAEISAKPPEAATDVLSQKSDKEAS